MVTKHELLCGYTKKTKFGVLEVLPNKLPDLGGPIQDDTLFDKYIDERISKFRKESTGTDPGREKQREKAFHSILSNGKRMRKRGYPVTKLGTMFLLSCPKGGIPYIYLFHMILHHG